MSYLYTAEASSPVQEPERISLAQYEAQLRSQWGYDWNFAGITTFAHLPHTRCLVDLRQNFDIALLGCTFDTATSYRPGARFGPRAIRAASARQTSFRGFNARAALNPYRSWARIMDCGDIPITPLDNTVAFRQMSEAFLQLGRRPSAHALRTAKGSKLHAQEYDVDEDYASRPRILSLGGDHSIALPALRALRTIYQQPIAVVYFDAHLDTWAPSLIPGHWDSEQSEINHGSVFWKAVQEGLVANGSSVHAGLRTRLSGTGFGDYEADSRQGFLQIETDDIDKIGVEGIVTRIIERVGLDVPVYLSVDIDVIDPGLAPGTGTPEPGGWMTRELIAILRGIEGLNVVGADVVEVVPTYDGPGEQTSLVAAQIAYEILTSLVKRGLRPGELPSEGVKSQVKDEL